MKNLTTTLKCFVRVLILILIFFSALSCAFDEVTEEETSMNNQPDINDQLEFNSATDELLWKSKVISENEELNENNEFIMEITSLRSQLEAKIIELEDANNLIASLNASKLENNNEQCVSSTTEKNMINDNNLSDDSELIASNNEELELCKADLLANLELITSAEKNLSLFEIKARIAKNEQNLARLATEQCQLDLEVAKKDSNDRVLVLQKEIESLKAIQEDYRSHLKLSEKDALDKQSNEDNNDGCAAFTNLYEVCNFSPCVNTINTMLLELIRSEYKESILTTMEPYVEKSIENINKAYYISSEYIKNDLYPLIMGYVNIIYNKTHEYYSQAVEISDNIYNNNIKPFYIINIEPTITNEVLPWYDKNMKPSVNIIKITIIQFYDDNCKEFVSEYIEPYYDYIKSKMSYFLYYLGEFISDEDRYTHSLDWIYYYIPYAINQLSNQPYLLSICGVENSLACSSVMVYFIIFLALYLVRKLIIGIIAGILVIILSPLLITIYICAKIIQILSPKTNKKSKQKLTKATKENDKKNLKVESLSQQQLPVSPIHYQYTNPMISKSNSMGNNSSPKAVQELRQRKVPNAGLSGMTPAAALGLVPPNRSKSYNQAYDNQPYYQSDNYLKRESDFDL